MNFADAYAESPDSPETPRIIKEVRDDLRSRISEFHIDLDDESIRGEVAKLSNHQDELQKELQAVMQVVQIVEFEDHYEDDLDLSLRDSFHKTGSGRSLGSIEPQPSSEDLDDTSRTRDSIHSTSSVQQKPSFAKAFFKLSRPEITISLEAQKERQKEIVKESLAAAHPGLEDIMEIQEEMQREIVQEHKDTLAEKEKGDHDLSPTEDLEEKEISLEEEKSKQMEMLAKRLQEIDPELMRQMTSQKNRQAEIVAKKELEIKRAQTPPRAPRQGRLTQTKSTKNFWNGAMSKLEGLEWKPALAKLENMVGRTPKVSRKSAPETIAEVLETDTD
ncbi:unnamed protein product [Cylindrotheca closterium]|uniref:Uncharacterized protein n=1 Tax=Cylindrotheca closterium TaxID=2856 RepID=A0AAD2FG80_9STRA|nr:unnamed protein product [Cylindrotheca closterium]